MSNNESTEILDIIANLNRRMDDLEEGIGNILVRLDNSIVDDDPCYDMPVRRESSVMANLRELLGSLRDQAFLDGAYSQRQHP